MMRRFSLLYPLLSYCRLQRYPQEKSLDGVASTVKQIKKRGKEKDEKKRKKSIVVKEPLDPKLRFNPYFTRSRPLSY